MEKIVAQGLLYDFYGPLLTKHQQKVYEQVVYENLSLNEIAAMQGTSKQAVHDLVRRTTDILNGYEESLHMMSHFKKVNASVEKLVAACHEKQDCEELKQAALAIASEIVEEIG